MRNGSILKGTLLIMAAAGMVFLTGPAFRAAAQSPFDQGLTLHETTTQPPMMGQPARTSNSTVYFSRDAMKRVGADGVETVIRFQTGTIITIDNKAKTYSEMTAAQLQEAMDKATSAAKMPKEQMEAMRKMMGQMSDSVAIAKEGPGEKIAGYDTVKYHMTGMMEMDIWAAPDLKIPALYYDAMKAQIPPNPFFDMRKMMDEFKKIEGMTLKSVMTMKMMGNEMKTTTLVNSVEKNPIPASVFAVPAGYTRKSAELPK